MVARYVIAPERSHLWIDARSNVHPIHSTTDGLEGFVDVEFEPTGGMNLGATPAGQLSLAVSKLSSGNRMEDRELHKRIDSRRFPTIEGVLGTVTAADGDASYKVSGDITFRGVSQHHEDLMQIRSVDDNTIELEGQSRFDIRDFGMEPPKMLMAKVQPEVDIRVAIVAVRDAGA
jgi:YceI-like domain